MKHLEISVAAESIARKFVENDADMNTAITKLANERDLNDEQVKRLVEESNKFAFLNKFEKTGEQIFDVADFSVVKQKLNPAIEKVAHVQFDRLQYGKTSHPDIVAANNRPVFEKVAEEVIEKPVMSKEQKQYCSLVKQACLLEEKAALKYGTQHHGLGLWKVATAHADHDYDDLVILYKQIGALEKTASIMTRVASNFVGKKWWELPGGLLNASFHLPAELGAAAAVSLTKGIAKGGVKTMGAVGAPLLTVAGMGHGRLSGAFNLGQMSSDAPKIVSHVNASGYTGDMLAKTASFLHHVLDVLAAGGKSAGGFLGGIAAETATKLGGGIALTMNQRELRDSFDTIMARNPDYAPKRVEMANYFDVIARHAPVVATDPVSSATIMKSFDAYGGVDLNAIKTLHEIQQKAEKH